MLQVPLVKFTHLRVLDLDGWTKLVDDDMIEICNKMSFSLKYLSIKQTSVTKLPREIKKLRNLETLDIRQTQISTLPSELCKLQNLKTLDLRRTKVTALPHKVINLPTLLYLLVGSDDSSERLMMPERIDQLSSLRTLATVDLTDCSSSVVQSLGCLESLRELAVIWSFHQSADKEYQDALRSSIKELRLLKSLTIYGDFGSSMEFLTDGHHPPRQLEKLTVTGKIVSVPDWIEGLRALVFLKVKVCKLDVRDLRTLAELRRLRYLELGLEFHPEQDIVIENMGFRVLERLSVDCRVPCLTFEAGAMPQLVELELKFSSGIAAKENMDISSICNLLSLEKIVLQHAKLNKDHFIVKEMRKEVPKHRNPIKLFIGNTELEVKASSTAAQPEQGNLARVLVYLFIYLEVVFFLKLKAAGDLPDILERSKKTQLKYEQGSCENRMGGEEHQLKQSLKTRSRITK